MKQIKLSLLSFAVAFLLFASQTYSQWTFVGFVTGGGTFPSISVYGPNDIAIFGGPTGSGKVFKSTNGGANFTDISGSGLLLELYCGWAKDGNTMFAGDGGASGGTGGNAHVYKTTNGGTSWTVALSTGGSAGFINAIVFSRSNPQIGIVQSDPPSGSGTNYWVQRSTDGGGTWSAVTTNSIPGAASCQNGIVCIDQNFFNFGTNATPMRLNMTTNGGSSWTVSNLSIAGTFLCGNAWSDNKMDGVTASSTSLPSISRTTNGGSTWTTVATGVVGAQTYCNLKWVNGTNTVYLLGTTGTSLARKSTDGGATWTGLTFPALTGVTHMDLLSQGGTVYVYAVCADGSVCKLSEPLGIDPNNQTVPSSYSLQQNYPNPFNPETNIKYSVPENSNVSIKIYNALGVEVYTVVDRYHTTGNYVESVNMSNFASGIYFYTMKSNNYTETKKMMLVK